MNVEDQERPEVIAAWKRCDEAVAEYIDALDESRAATERCALTRAEVEESNAAWFALCKQLS